MHSPYAVPRARSADLDERASPTVRSMTTQPQPERVRLRAALEDVPAYVPGRAVAATDELTAYKVSSNENPFPPLESVRAAIAQAAATVNRYPDMAVSALTARIARELGVEPVNIATGTGSVGVLGQVVTATCDPGDEVVYAWRSFEAYPIVVALAGAQSVQVGLDADARHRLDAMLAAVTERTKAVLVCSPNNPTGTVVHRGELEHFLDRVPEHVLVVLDEAYLEFVTDPEAPDALAVWRERANVMLLRTFSKAYGLAGLRVGYAVAHPGVAAALRKTAVPFGVSSIAQVAAVASLDAVAEMQVRVEALVAERRRVAAALSELGWRLPDSEANFVWFPLRADSTAFTEACRRAGLLVRQYGQDGVRVTIGEVAANDRLVEVARGFGTR